ncbi:MAG: hypothetical protein R3C15_06340 [Thermoleophilia bacterium]
MDERDGPGEVGRDGVPVRDPAAMRLVELDDWQERQGRAGRQRPGVVGVLDAEGPTAVRRSEAQCPPSASAIARTYVPLDTCNARVTSGGSKATTTASWTVDRRNGISTWTPRRCSS